MCESGVVACHPGSSILNGLLVFSKVTLLYDGGFIAIGVDPMISDSFTEGRDHGRFRGWPFDIFPEVPFEEFVIRFDFPFSVVVICPVINDFGKFSSVGVVIGGHGFG